MNKLELIKALLCEDYVTASSEKSTSPFIGENVVVRTYSAGVHVGRLVAKDGTNVLLEDSYRLWKWEGAFTLSEVANKGVTGGRRGCCTTIELTQSIEIIPINDIAFSSIKNLKDE